MYALIIGRLPLFSSFRLYKDSYLSLSVSPNIWEKILRVFHLKNTCKEILINCNSSIITNNFIVISVLPIQLVFSEVTILIA